MQSQYVRPAQRMSVAAELIAICSWYSTKKLPHYGLYGVSKSQKPSGGHLTLSRPYLAANSETAVVCVRCSLGV